MKRPKFLKAESNLPNHWQAVSVDSIKGLFIRARDLDDTPRYDIVAKLDLRPDEMIVEGDFENEHDAALALDFLVDELNGDD